MGTGTAYNFITADYELTLSSTLAMLDHPPIVAHTVSQCLTLSRYSISHLTSQLTHLFQGYRAFDHRQPSYG